MYGDVNENKVIRPRIVLFPSGLDKEVVNNPSTDTSEEQTTSQTILEQDLNGVSKYAAAIGVSQPFRSNSIEYGLGIRPRHLSRGSPVNGAISQAFDTRSASGTSKNNNRLNQNDSGQSGIRYPRRPMAPESRLRTNFTTSNIDFNSSRYQFDPLATSSRERPVHPEVSTLVGTRHHEFSMRIECVLIACALGMGIGAAISGHTSSLVTYWITTIGNLFIRTTACLVVPMAFCHVIISTAELVNNRTLRLVWKSLLRYLVIVTIAAMWCMLILIISFRTLYQRMEYPNLQLKHHPFAFRCHNNKFIEQHSNGSLTCTGTSVVPNTTFPQVVDVHQRLGIEQAVGYVDLSEYTMALLDVYFPKNLVQALAKDNALSSLIVAAVIGAAVGLSYISRPGSIKNSTNPLFRLLTHVYLSLFMILEWIQVVALWFTIPIMIGTVLVIPNLWETLRMARIYFAVLFLGAMLQVFVIVPLAFYLVTRENPYKWMRSLSVPTTYAFIFNSSFLPMLSTTTIVIRSGQVDPVMFGALYPLLSVLNTTGYALDLPNAIMYVAEFSGCTSTMTTTRSFMFFGTILMGSFGETMLPQNRLTLFLSMWRSFCQEEDTPGAFVLLSLISVITYRLAVAVNTLTNLMLIRMVSFQLEEAQQEQGPLSPVFSTDSIEPHEMYI